MTDELLNKLHNDLTNLLDTLDAMIAAREVDSGACSAPQELEMRVTMTTSMIDVGESMRLGKSVYRQVGEPVTTIQDTIQRDRTIAEISQAMADLRFNKDFK